MKPDKSSLNFLAAEADSLLEQAKKLRAEMAKLPEGDARRPVYDGMIRELLDRSRKFSERVISATG